MKKVVNVLKGICTIILALSIIVLVMAQIISSTILSEDYIIGKLEETNYYINTYTQVRDDFENYIYQSGLEKEVIEDIVTIEDIKKDTNAIIYSIYNGNNAKIDTSKVRDNLNKNIDKSLSGKNITASTQKAIDQFVNKIVEQYEESLLHTKFENQINQIIQKAQKYTELARKVSITAIGITTIFILGAYYRKIWKNIAILGIPLVSSGLFYEAVDIYINYRVKIANIMILNDAVTVTLRNILMDVFNNIRSLGFVLLILGTILIILGNIIRAKKHAEHAKKYKELQKQ